MKHDFMPNLIKTWKIRAHMIVLVLAGCELSNMFNKNSFTQQYSPDYHMVRYTQDGE